MIRDAIDKILGLAAVQELEIGDRPYTDKPIHPVKEPMPETLDVTTLTAIQDYINSEIDGVGKGNLLINVDTEFSVSLHSELLGSFQQRIRYMHAMYGTKRFPFENWMDIERFIIGIQSMFEADDNTAGMLKIVGNVQDGHVTTHKDDGVSQEVKVRSGVAKVESIDVPSPIMLTPYRTFPEIAQPQSSFIFRMRSGGQDGMLPTCALFEADGGRWKLTAIARIKEWLSERLEGVTIIA